MHKDRVIHDLNKSRENKAWGKKRASASRKPGKSKERGKGERNRYSYRRMVKNRIFCSFKKLDGRQAQDRVRSDTKEYHSQLAKNQ